MKKVQILLSTYNGEKFLSEQIESILNQTYQNISILIRDDGSTDGTVSILHQFATENPCINFYVGENIGVKDSFFDLIKNADLSADYYAFSDQDDVWLEDKVKSAVEKLDSLEKDNPLLYCGKATLVDESLTTISSSIRKHTITPSFGNALVENVCTGCTCMMNRKLLELIQGNIPEYTIMHDWWFYLVASAFGHIYYDEESYILYRQHGNNVVGARGNYLDEFRMRVKNYKKSRGQISRQAKEFLGEYSLESDKKELLKLVVDARKNLRYRMNIIGSKEIFRQRKMDNFIFKILFFLGNV